MGGAGGSREEPSLLTASPRLSLVHVKRFFCGCRSWCRVIVARWYWLVIRDLALPHDEDDLQPFGAQRPQRLAMRVSPCPLLVVVRSGPLTREHREERHLIDHVPQRLVAGEAELDDPLLAAPLRHGHGAGLRLQMAKRLPPPGGVAQAGPERRRGDAVLPDREGPRPLCRRHAGEKILDRLSGTRRRPPPPAVSCATKARINRALARTTWAGTGSCGCWRRAQSSWVRASLSRWARAHRCHWPCREGGHRLRRRIGLQELPRQRRRQLGDLQGPRIVRLQRGRQLVDQARLLPDLPLIVFREQLELLGRLRTRLQGAEVRRDPCGGSRPAPGRQTDHSSPHSAETDPGPGPAPWDSRDRRRRHGRAGNPPPGRRAAQSPPTARSPAPATRPVPGPTRSSPRPCAAPCAR